MSSGRQRPAETGVASVDHFVRRYAELAPRAGEPGWLRALRDEAIGRFAELGWPDRKLEDWRYTSVAPIERGRFETPERAGAGVTPAAPDVLGALSPPTQDAWRMIFVDGRFAAELSSLPAGDGGLQVRSLAQARAAAEGDSLLAEHLTRLASLKESAFVALGTAFLDDGAVVEIGAGMSIERPLHLLFVSTRDGSVVHPRVLVVARQGSRATLLQDHVAIGGGTRLTNSVAELFVEENARLDHVVVQRESERDLHVSTICTSQQRDSGLALHTFTLGGALVRNDVQAVLADSGAEVDLRGLFLGTGDAHVDNHTLVDHAMPHCSSRELYKGVLGDRSRGVFRGRVVVRPDAQKSDAQQSNPNLLLTDQAEIDTKPQLEIYADDVKCSHGATIGQLDAEALFYLRSRAIDELEARALLTRGFANEICEALPQASLAAWAHRLVDESLTVLAEGGAEGRS